MAPSRAPPTLTSLASALIHPRLRPRPIPPAAIPKPGLTSGPATASRIRYRHYTLPSQSPSPVSVVRLRFRKCYSTAPVKVKPHSPADGGNADELKAVEDGDGDGAADADSAAGPQPPDYLSAGERGVFEKVKRELAPSRLEVQDISGGCGSMYAIEVVSSRFRGMSVVRQHRLVNEVLREEIRGWHGVQLKTRAG